MTQNEYRDALARINAKYRAAEEAAWTKYEKIAIAACWCHNTHRNWEQFQREIAEPKRVFYAALRAASAAREQALVALEAAKEKDKVAEEYIEFLTPVDWQLLKLR
jgi:hypothetical protein